MTIQNVKDQSRKVWGYERTLLVDEYIAKPMVPPPLNIPFSICRITKYVYQKCQPMKSRNKHTNDSEEPFKSKSSWYYLGVQKIYSVIFFLVKKRNEMQRPRKLADSCWWYTLKRERMDQIEAVLKKVDPQ